MADPSGYDQLERKCGNPLALRRLITVTFVQCQCAFHFILEAMSKWTLPAFGALLILLGPSGSDSVRPPICVGDGGGQLLRQIPVPHESVSCIDVHCNFCGCSGNVSQLSKFGVQSGLRTFHRLPYTAELERSVVCMRWQCEVLVSMLVWRPVAYAFIPL